MQEGESEGVGWGVERYKLRRKTTHIVISGIFNSCDGEDKDQRHNGGEPGQGGDLWDQLRKGKRMHTSEAPSYALFPSTPFSSLTLFGLVSYLQRVYHQSLTCRMRRNRK